MSKGKKHNMNRRNDRLVESMRLIAARNHDLNVEEASITDSTQIYCSVAIALYNTLEGTHEEKAEQITTFMQEVQLIWNRAIHGDDLIAECKQLTGLDIVTDYIMDEDEFNELE